MVSASYVLGMASRPDTLDVSAFVDLILSVLEAFHSRGIESLLDTSHAVIRYGLEVLNLCRTFPGVEGKVRAAAPALTFCLENDIDWFEAIGSTTGATAAALCEY